MELNNFGILEILYVVELNNLIGQENLGAKTQELDLDIQFSQKVRKPLAFSCSIEKSAHKWYSFLSKVKNLMFQPFWGPSGSC